MVETNKQKHGLRWSCDEVEALLTGIGEQSNHVLGSFSLGVTAASRKDVWEKITTMVSFMLTVLL